MRLILKNNSNTNEKIGKWVNNIKNNEIIRKIEI